MAAISLSPRSGAMSNKDHALMYAAMGWHVFPVFEITAEGVCSCQEGAACGRPGKHPRSKDGLKDASAERHEVELWWSKFPGASIGIVTGEISGITVVDADAAEGKPGLINLTRLCAPHGGVPQTLISETGGGGLHLVFEYSDRLKTGSNVLDEAIDVRSDGGYIIAPPSNHKSGRRYKWRQERGELLALPDWLLAIRKGEAPGKKKKRGRPRLQAGAKIDRVETMVGHVDPDDRDKWLGMGIILGRLYVGSPEENDAWNLYESWASRSAKFDEDRAGNVARMREAFYESSQAETRAGGAQLSLGSLIHWAREGGWKPFGDRVAVRYEPGDESIMAEALAAALIAHDENRYFNVMGQLRDVLKTQQPITRMMQKAAESGWEAPETLVVRPTTAPALLDSLSRVAVLETTDRNGNPRAQPISGPLAAMILAQHATRFPALSGIAEWPMVGADGRLIMQERGYDPTTGLYFDIDKTVAVNEKLSAEQGWAWLKSEFLADFPFEDEVTEAGALAMMLSFMQRPLMKTCPAFAVTAPQPKSGKSTLVEIASLAVHGFPIAPHAFSWEDEEMRKALHALMLYKIPAIMFDNVGRGKTINSDHLAKLITSEISADRTLGSSLMQKEVNTLLITFTGNNIAFVQDMASRVMMLRLNAKTSNPMARTFRHRDVKAWAPTVRNEVLSALVAIMRTGLSGPEAPGFPSRFEDFDSNIVRAVIAVTGRDCRPLMTEDNAADAEEEESTKGAMALLRRWQQTWRKEQNGRPWKTSELVAAVDQKLFDDSGLRILRHWINNEREWEANPARALGNALRNISGDYKFEPFLLKGSTDSHTKTNNWVVEGPEVEAAPAAAQEAF